MGKKPKRLNKKGRGKLTQGSNVKRIMSPSELQSKSKTQNSKISTHEWVGSYTHSSRKTHLPQAQANVQLQKNIQSSFTTQWTHHFKSKNFPLHLRNLKPVFTPITHTHLTPNCIKKKKKKNTIIINLNSHTLWASHSKTTQKPHTSHETKLSSSRTKTVNMKIFKTSFQVQAKFGTQNSKRHDKIIEAI